MAATKLPSITLTPEHFSDVWFNHDMQNYNRVNRRNGTADDIRQREYEALKQDAKEFLDMAGNPPGVDEEMLVEDFYNRL